MGLADALEDVLPHCVAVMGIDLVGLHAPVEFGDEFFGDARCPGSP